MTLQRNAAAVRRFAKLMNFVAWLQKLPNKLTPPPFRLIQIGSAFWQSRALYVAARLDIATVLADESLTIDLIAQRISVNTDAVNRLLRMLVAMGIFAEEAPGVFKNNVLSAHLRTDHPQNVRAMILLHNSPEMSRPWFEQLEQSVRNGEVAFERVHDQPLVAYMDSHSDFDHLFASAMDGVEVLTGDSFTVDFAWERFERIIDVGGSKGSKALAILKRHPQLTALVYDREAVVRNATDYWIGKVPPERLSRLSFVGGDLLESAPAAKSDKDIYLLSAVLHGMDDDNCLKVLGNLMAASAGTGARIAVMELVVAESNADFTSATFDMQMMVNTHGRERTQTQWQRLCDKAGLLLEEVVDLHSFVKILVFKQYV